MSIDVFSANIRAVVGFNAQKNITGVGGPITNAPTINKAIAYAQNGNDDTQNTDSALCITLSIAGNGSATIDLMSFVDVVNDGSSSIAFIRAVQVRNLSVNDDPVNGGGSGTITVGPNASNGNNLFMTGTTPAHLVFNGGIYLAAAPQGNHLTVDSSHKQIKITNSDSITAGVEVTIFGSGT